jgi:hypothetical protein
MMHHMVRLLFMTLSPWLFVELHELDNEEAHHFFKNAQFAEGSTKRLRQTSDLEVDPYAEVGCETVPLARVQARPVIDAICCKRVFLDIQKVTDAGEERNVI